MSGRPHFPTSLFSVFGDTSRRGFAQSCTQSGTGLIGKVIFRSLRMIEQQGKGLVKIASQQGRAKGTSELDEGGVCGSGLGAWLAVHDSTLLLDNAIADCNLSCSCEKCETFGHSFGTPFRQSSRLPTHGGAPRLLAGSGRVDKACW